MDGSMSPASTEALVALARCVLNSGAPGGPERLIDAALQVIEHGDADAVAAALMSEGETTATDEARELVELSDEVSERVERARRPTVRVPGAERRGPRPRAPSRPPPSPAPPRGPGRIPSPASRS